MSDSTGKEPIKKIADTISKAARVESEPAPVRGYRVWIFRIALLFVAGAFGVLTFLITILPSFTIDLQITRAIQMVNLPPFALLMSLISWPGFTPQSIIITGLIILLMFGIGLHWEAVMALIAAVLSSGLNLMLKDWIQRPRPTSNLVNVISKLNDYSFPSGHVMFYISFFGFIGFLAFSMQKPSFKRTLLLVFVGGLVTLVGVSRIYLGEHWASDILGSYLLGSLMLVAIIHIYLWGRILFFVHQPAAETGP